MCGSLGPMVCLNGASCNQTVGFCENCPTGYRDDEVLYQGNQNCGLSIAGIGFVYLFTAVFGLAVSATALSTAIYKKKSRMRKILFLVAIWNFTLPFLMLSHYLEGYRFGIVSTILFTAVLMMVNTQVSVMRYTIDTFMKVLCKNSTSNEHIYNVAVGWYVFWMIDKLVCGIVMLVGLGSGDVRLYNIGQVTLDCCLLVEVGANVVQAYRHDGRIYRAVKALHKDLKQNSMNPVVLEFAARVQKSQYILPFYALVIVTAGSVVPVLFVIYDSSVPYAFVVFALIATTWPLCGFEPIILMRTKLGQQIDRTGRTTTPIDGSHTGGPFVSKSPRSTSKNLDRASNSKGHSATGEELVARRGSSSNAQ